jgi:hypothetical protein
MNFTLSDEHLLLRNAAQAFVDGEVNLAPLLVPGARLERPYYEALWAKIDDPRVL